jgi:hypothetical protein
MDGEAGDAAVEAPAAQLPILEVPMAEESGYMCPYDASVLTVA